MRRALVLGIVTAAWVVACGLDVTGIPNATVDGGPTPEAPPGTPPGAPPATPPGAPPGTPPGTTPPSSCTCALVPETGFTLVAYASDRAATCPGDMTAADVVADPGSAADACSCGTCLTATVPSCTGGTFGTTYDQGAAATCGTTSGVTHPGNNGACGQYDNFLANHSRAIAPNPAGPSACSAAGVGHADLVKSTSARTCTQTGATCACDPGLPPAFKTCMRAPGDVACPPSAPNKHLVGATVDVACPACGCAMTATCSGTIQFFSDTGCNTLVASVTTAACGNTNSVDYKSYKWLGTTTPSCTLTPAPGAASVTAPSTVCCP